MGNPRTPVSPSAEALRVLGEQRGVQPAAQAGVPDRPGLYAIKGDAGVWAELGLGHPPDDRPLYVGKAERSLAGRDLRQHFGTGLTGWSTLRRSLAALLRARLRLVAVPRSPGRPSPRASYGLEEAGDARLTAWMNTNLRIATWVPAERVRLADIERELLQIWEPPLNLTGVRNPWTGMVKAARRTIAASTRSPADSPDLGVPPGEPDRRSGQ